MRADQADNVIPLTAMISERLYVDCRAALQKEIATKSWQFASAVGYFAPPFAFLMTGARSCDRHRSQQQILKNHPVVSAYEAMGNAAL